MLGRRPIKWRQCPAVNKAVDWSAKSQLKQTNNKLVAGIEDDFFGTQFLHLSRKSSGEENIFQDKKKQKKADLPVNNITLSLKDAICFSI